MSTELEQIRERVTEFLNSRGVSAVTAWPMAPRREPERTVEPGGLQNYLGDRFDEETGRWEERYGRKARLTLGLDLYAPEKGDGQAVQRAFDKLVQVFLLEEPEGLAVEELSCGETVRDGESRRLKRPVDVVCTAWLSAGTDAGGAFTDFDLRGVMKV